MPSLRCILGDEMIDQRQNTRVTWNKKLMWYENVAYHWIDNLHMIWRLELTFQHESRFCTLPIISQTTLHDSESTKFNHSFSRIIYPSRTLQMRSWNGKRSEEHSNTSQKEDRPHKWKESSKDYHPESQTIYVRIKLKITCTDERTKSTTASIP
jgi:hypothetical protein